MTPNELIQRLRRLARKRNLAFEMAQGRGSHMNVMLGNRRSVIAIHPGDIKPGTFRAIVSPRGIDKRDL